MATRTLIQVIQAVADNLNARESGTATAGAAASLTCATHPFITNLTNADTTKYVGDELYIASGTGLGQARQITAYAPSTGIFTPSANWATNPDATSVFDIYKKGLRHDVIKDAVNAAIIKLRYQMMIPVTLVTDGDMETSGTGSWTATNVTHTKVATAGGLLHGTQSSRAVCSVANGNLQSGTITCVPGDGYTLQARCRAAVGTAKLVAYDVTNSAEIATGTWDEVGWGGIYFNFSTPSTCESLAIRLQGVESNADIYWDDVQLMRQNAREWSLPSHITRPGQVLGLYCDASRDRWDEDRYTPYYWYDVIPDYNNPLSQYRLQLYGAATLPMWMLVSRPFGTLSADTSTTQCDQEWIEIAATVELLDRLINLAPGQEIQAWKQEYTRKRRKLAVLNSVLMPKPTFRYHFDGRPVVPVNRGV